MANAFLLLSPVDFLGGIDEDPSVDTHLDTHLNLSIIKQQQSEPFKEMWCKEMNSRTKVDETRGTRDRDYSFRHVCVFSRLAGPQSVCVCV